VIQTCCTTNLRSHLAELFIHKDHGGGLLAFFDCDKNGCVDICILYSRWKLATPEEWNELIEAANFVINHAHNVMESERDRL